MNLLALLLFVFGVLLAYQKDNVMSRKKTLTHRLVFRASGGRVGLTSHASQWMLFASDYECDKAFYDRHKNGYDENVQVYEYRGLYTKCFVSDKRLKYKYYPHYVRVETERAIYHFYSCEIEIGNGLALEIAQKEDNGEFLSVCLHKGAWAK